MRTTTISLSILFSLLTLGAVGCSEDKAAGAGGAESGEEKSLEVTASAYTMAEDETKKGNVGLSAWGDQLKPGMKSIAVSRDLIEEGLTHR